MKILVNNNQKCIKEDASCQIKMDAFVLLEYPLLYYSGSTRPFGKPWIRRTATDVGARPSQPFLFWISCGGSACLWPVFGGDWVSVHVCSCAFLWVQWVWREVHQRFFSFSASTRLISFAVQRFRLAWASSAAWRSCEICAIGSLDVPKLWTKSVENARRQCIQQKSWSA